MKKVTLLLALSLLLVSCAKEMSREEQLAINNKNISAANKIYSGFSKEDIANAVTKTLELIDPSDSKFTHYENKIIMMRRYFFTLLFNTVIGSDCWIVTFEKLNDQDVSVSLSVSIAQAAGMVPVGNTTASTNPDKTSVPSECESRLFFKRVDYFLGIEKKWISCKEAKKFMQDNNYYSDNPSSPFPLLCGDNYFGIEAKDPQ